MPRPLPAEHAPYFSKYLDLVTSENIAEALIQQTAELMPFWRSLTEAQSTFAPAGKWTVKQVLNHVTDTERVFSYRALRIGRGDTTPLPGFEQDVLASHSGAAARSWASLADEHQAVRAATLHLVKTFPEEAWSRLGNSSNAVLSTRAAVYAIAGHELHHVAILRAQYL